MTQNKNTKKHIINILLTLVVVLLLIFSGPVSAVDVRISNLSSASVTAGTAVTFQITIELTDQNERLNMSDSNTNFTIVMGNSSTAVSGNCTFSMGAGPSIGGNSTICDRFNVTRVTQISTTLGYGYLSGYGYTAETATSRTNVTFGYGYGYGYGNSTNSANVYNVSFNTTSLTAASYEIDVLFTHNINSQSSNFWSNDNQDTTIAVSAASSTAAAAAATSSSSGSSARVTQSPIVPKSTIAEVGQGQQARFRFDAFTSPIIRVIFTAQRQLTDISMSVAHTLTRTDVETGTGQSVPPRRAYAYVDLLRDNFDSSDIGPDGARVEFRVNRNWLEQNGLDVSNIALYRFDGTNWIQLETTPTDQDEQYAYFESRTPGFSYFVIGEKVSQTPGVVSTPEETPAAPVQETTQPEVKEAKGVSTGMVVLVIVLVLIAALVIYYFVGKKDSKRKN